MNRTLIAFGSSEERFPAGVDRDLCSHEYRSLVVFFYDRYASRTALARLNVRGFCRARGIEYFETELVSIHEGRQGSEGERRASGSRQAPERCQAARAKDATDGSAGAGSATGCAVGGRLSSSRRAASMRHGSHGPKSAGGFRPFRAQASR